MGVPPEHLTDADYRALLRFRTGLRRFEQWSAARARDAGVTPAQHQLMLAIRGSGAQPPTISDIADQLLLRHHSVVELIDRAEAADLLRRVRDPNDQRIVRLHLTDEGLAKLEALSAQHRAELERVRPHIAHIWDGLD